MTNCYCNINLWECHLGMKQKQNNNNNNKKAGKINIIQLQYIYVYRSRQSWQLANIYKAVDQISVMCTNTNINPSDIDTILTLIFNYSANDVKAV